MFLRLAIVFLAASWPTFAQNEQAQMPESAESLFLRGNRLQTMAAAEGSMAKAAEAFSLLLRAAEQGHSPSASAVGEALLSGMGTPRDNSKATYWLKRAADSGEPTAQQLLGLCFLEGVGVPQNLVEAHKWTYFAASQEELVSSGRARFQLGLLHLSGTGVDANPSIALKWFRLTMPFMMSQEYLDLLDSATEDALSQLSAEEIARVDQEVQSWQPKTWDQLQEEQEAVSQTLRQDFIGVLTTTVSVIAVFALIWTTMGKLRVGFDSPGAARVGLALFLRAFGALWLALYVGLKVAAWHYIYRTDGLTAMFSEILKSDQYEIWSGFLVFVILAPGILALNASYRLTSPPQSGEE